MTQEEFLQRLEQSINTNVAIVRKTLPYGKEQYTDKNGNLHPGHLQNNLYKLKKIDETHYDIFIDTSLDEYPVTINSPGYKTSGYWNKSCEELIKLIAADLNGKLE